MTSASPISIEEFKARLNNWGKEKTPFLFAIDFEMEKPLCWRLDEVNSDEVLFDFNGFSNAGDGERVEIPGLSPRPITLDQYVTKFDVVMRHLLYGDSFITNLTIKTPISSGISLRNLFFASRAHYKLWIRNQFLVFSPENFIRVKDDSVFAFPMKGTINALIPGAEEKLLTNPKETAEHVTIVDLLRNDLSQVAAQVKVGRFRYVDKIITNERELLQMSSEINGRIIGDAFALGDLLISLIPAGSVTGAPKAKTLEIIREAEGEKRGYYTGICGIFDGRQLDSAVMIRFIEQDGDRFFYRSGGGITTQSDPHSEYQEALDKIYVPLN